MRVAKKQKTWRSAKSNEQKEAGLRLQAFLKENKLKDGDEICLAIYRLMCLGFKGGNGLDIKKVYSLLPIAFDKYLEHGFCLNDNEKIFMKNHKEIILSLLKPFYWEENGDVIGMAFKLQLPDYIDGFSGVFDLDTQDFAI
jgi:hypothetical protein